jgi:chromate transporter
MSSHILLDLAAVFAPLSLATIGGGQAIIADIQRQVVEVHGWMTHAQFAADFAISRMAPGPGSLLVTLIGWQVAGLWGAVVATAALLLPSGFLVFGVTHLWGLYKGAAWQLALERGLRPVAAGMMLAAGWVLLKSLNGGPPARMIAVASLAMLLWTRISPFLLLLMGALALLGVYWLGADLPGWCAVRLST